MFILLTCLYLTACKSETPPTEFSRNGVSFTVPKGWSISEEEDYGTGYYVSIEKEGFSESGIFMVTWVEGDISPEEFMELLYSYYEYLAVYKNSKINLNISLRSIQSGIPLRAFDIMGCGGFLLTNYQGDFMEHFVPGEDFVYYENRQDLVEKVTYYLSHEEERKQIAQSGYEKVKQFHTYRHRVAEMLRVIGGF